MAEEIKSNLEENCENANSPAVENVISTLSYCEADNEQAASTSSVADSSSSFSDSNMMKCRAKFLEVIEELKMKREVNNRSEKKIQELILVKYKLEQNMEEQQQRLSEALEDHMHKEAEIEQRCSEKIKQIKEDNLKLSYISEAKEKEFQILKDEIRTLYMTKYTLEKKIGEQEHTIQVLTSSREDFHAQLSQLEQFCTDIEKEVVEVTQQINSLESNVKEATLLNKKLQYVNDHQECLIKEHKEELNDCHRELCEIKANSSRQPNDTITNIERKTIQELKVQKEIVNQIEAQLSQLQEEHCSVLQSLKEAHALIDEHVENSVKSASIEADLKEETCKLKLKTDSLEQQLALKCEKSNNLKNILQDKLKISEDMVLDLTHRLKTLQEDYSHLKSSNEEMNENLNHLQIEKENTIVTIDKLKDDLEQHQKIIALIREENFELTTKISKKTTQDKAVETDFDDTKSPTLYSSPEILSSQRTPPTKRSLADNDSLEPELKKLKATTGGATDDTKPFRVCWSIVESLLEKFDYSSSLKSIDETVPCIIETTNPMTSEITTDVSSPISSVIEPAMNANLECNIKLISFSDDDDEELMDTQLCDKINHAQSILKKDRLKRTKVSLNQVCSAAGLPAMST